MECGTGRTSPQSRPRRSADEVGGGIGQGRQDGRLAEASATAGISGPPTPLGGGTLICLDLPQQEDEQRLREVVCNQRGVCVRCHESPHAEAIGSHLRLFHTVSLSTPVNKAKKGQGMEALALKTSAIAEQTVDTCPS